MYFCSNKGRLGEKETFFKKSCPKLLNGTVNVFTDTEASAISSINSIYLHSGCLCNRTQGHSCERAAASLNSDCRCVSKELHVMQGLFIVLNCTAVVITLYYIYKKTLKITFCIYK